MQPSGKEEADEEPRNPGIFEDVDEIRDEESGHHRQGGGEELDDVVEDVISGRVFGLARSVASADNHENVVGDGVDE